MHVSSALHAFWAQNNFLIICSFIVFAFTLYHRLDNINFTAFPRYFQCDTSPYINRPGRFVGYVNYGVDVPNIVHYIRFGVDAVCFTNSQVQGLLSVIRNQQPAEIYIHTDNVTAVAGLVSRIAAQYSIRNGINVRYYPQPKHAFGLNFSSEHRAEHAVDFTKLKVLRRYGGIFLDNNVQITRNLRKFLNFEMTVTVRPTPEGDLPVELSDSLIVAHRDARFLRSWLKTYHEYDEREPKHATSAAMKALLKKDVEYIYKLENDLPADLKPGSKEFLSAASSRKHFFVVTRDDRSRCVV